MSAPVSPISVCNHNIVDSWHISDDTDEGYALVRQPVPRAWSLWKQIKVDAKARNARYTWGALFLGFGVSLAFSNWITLAFTGFGLLFFGRGAYEQIRNVKHGRLLEVSCSTVKHKGTIRGRDVWHAYASIDGRDVTVPIICSECADAIESDGSVEALVLIDPGSKPRFASLIGFRRSSAR